MSRTTFRMNFLIRKKRSHFKIIYKTSGNCGRTRGTPFALRKKNSATRLCVHIKNAVILSAHPIYFFLERRYFNLSATHTYTHNRKVFGIDWISQAMSFIQKCTRVWLVRIVHRWIGNRKDLRPIKIYSPNFLYLLLLFFIYDLIWYLSLTSIRNLANWN